MKLVKEIRDRNGKLYFKRWRVLNLPFFYVDLHKFYQSPEDRIYDKDGHLHSHPHEFWTMILSGGYKEVKKENIDSLGDVIHFRKPFQIAYVNKDCFHRVDRLLGSTCTTLIIKKKKRRDWGFLVDGKVISNEEYRANKNPIDTYDDLS